MATSGENYWPSTGRTSWPLTYHSESQRGGPIGEARTLPRVNSGASPGTLRSVRFTKCPHRKQGSQTPVRGAKVNAYQFLQTSNTARHGISVHTQYRSGID